MSQFSAARDALDRSVAAVVPDTPEWIQLDAARAALDQAERADAACDFALASHRIDDAIARLQAVPDGTRHDPAPRLQAALQQLLALAHGIDAALAGEPASALPGMDVVNRSTFPASAAPPVPPLRQTACDLDGAGSSDVAAAIDAMLRRAGGYVDHPDDRGGPTRFGITMRTLAAVRGQPVSRADVRALPRDEARDIVRRYYYAGPRLDLLPPLIQPLMFDMSINHGPGTAVRLLQRLLDDNGHACTVDGGIGDETSSAAGAMVALLGHAVVGMLVDRRVALYEQIAARDASQRVFLRGWLGRAEGFRLA